MSPTCKMCGVELSSRVAIYLGYCPKCMATIRRENHSIAAYEDAQQLREERDHPRRAREV